MSQYSINWRRVKDFAASVREGVVILGILAGGIWAYYKFSVSESVQSKLEYERQLYNAKAFGLQIDVSARAEYRERCVVIGTVVIRNIGVSTAHLLVDRQKPIAVASIAIGDDGHVVARRSAQFYWIDDPDRLPREEVTITPGRNVTLAFVAPASPGVYNHVRFRTPVVFGELPTNPSTDDLWSARAIIPTCIAERALPLPSV